MKSYHNDITNGDGDDAYDWTDHFIGILKQDLTGESNPAIGLAADVGHATVRNVLNGKNAKAHLINLMKVAYCAGYRVKLEPID